MERVAFSEYGLAAMSHRGGVLGWDTPLPAAAKYALTYLFVQAEFGLCCPLSMTDSLTRTLRKFGAPGTGRALPAEADHAGLRRPDPGRDVHDRTGRRLRRGRHRHARRARTATRYRLHGDKWFCSNPDADLAMVLARIDGAPAGMKGVSLFLLPRTLRRRLGQRLPHRAAEGQAGHALDGQRRDPASNGARAYLVGEAGRGFQQMADMVNNSRLSQRRARRRADAPRLQRGAVHRARTPRLRQAPDATCR